GGDRHGSSPQLRDEPVALAGGKPFGDAICSLDEVHGLLPNPEIAIAPHRSSCLSGFAHDTLRKGVGQILHARPGLASSFRSANHRFLADPEPRAPSPEPL